jgi:hypothetical protein
MECLGAADRTILILLDGAMSITVGNACTRGDSRASHCRHQEGLLEGTTVESYHDAYRSALRIHRSLECTASALARLD